MSRLSVFGVAALLTHHSVNAGYSLCKGVRNSCCLLKSQEMSVFITGFAILAVRMKRSSKLWRSSWGCME